MWKRQQKQSNKRNNCNNRGLSLVELLIAVTILAIIIVPLLRAFVSSAKLNMRAQRTLKATMIAENIMEEFEDASIADLAAKYSATALTGVYTFDFDAADLTEFDAEQYEAKVTLDPNTSYSAYNQISTVDVSPVTKEHSAVYAENPTYEASVYRTFEERNIAARAADPAAYAVCDADFFEQNLNRTISIVVSKGSEVTDADGNQVTLANVVMTIEYSYNNGTVNAVLPTDTRFSEKRELFDNTTTKKSLEQIFIIYRPRYKACDPALGANAKEDTINIRNLGNLETKVSVIRQETADDSTDLTTYLQNSRAKVTIFESPAWTGAYNENTPAAISLRTNLVQTDIATGLQTRSFNLIFSNETGTQKESGDVAARILDLKNAEGMNLDGSSAKNRIYDMKVEVYHTSDPTEAITVLEGTKVD